jgi:hypothetical protein
VSQFGPNKNFKKPLSQQYKNQKAVKKIKKTGGAKVERRWSEGFAKVLGGAKVERRWSEGGAKVRPS